MASLTYFRRVSYTNSHSSFHCGIYFGNLRIENPEANPTIIISVRPAKQDSSRCGICGKKCSGYDKGNGKRRWRAMDIGNSSKVYLESDSPRVWCREHGVTVQQVPWARHGSNIPGGLRIPLYGCPCTCQEKQYPSICGSAGILSALWSAE